MVKRNAEVTVTGAKEARAPIRKRSYEAAQTSRNGGSWMSAIRSADAEIFMEARTLRDKSRALVRNNPFAARAIIAVWSRHSDRGNNDLGLQTEAFFVAAFRDRADI